MVHFLASPQAPGEQEGTVSALDTGVQHPLMYPFTQLPNHPVTHTLTWSSARVTGFGCTPAPVGVRRSRRETASTFLGPPGAEEADTQVCPVTRSMHESTKSARVEYKMTVP